MAAFATIVGIVIAGLALIMARSSAADAARSAEAAERTARAAEEMSQASVSTLDAATEQLRLARAAHERLEADRGRRPIVTHIAVTEVQPRTGAETPPGIFRLGFKNDGDRELAGAILTILIDPGGDAILTDRWGNPASNQPKDETRERWPGVVGDPRAFDCIPLHTDVPVGTSVVQYVCVTRVGGRFPIRVKLFSAALEGNGPWIDAWVDVDAVGVATVARLPQHTEGRYGGRHTDFD